jgi:hypothetical protein
MSSLFILAICYYDFEWSNRRDAHGQSTYKPLAGVMFTGLQYAFSLLTRTVGHNRDRQFVPICSQKPYLFQKVLHNVALIHSTQPSEPEMNNVNCKQD